MAGKGEAHSLIAVGFFALGPARAPLRETPKGEALSHALPGESGEAVAAAVRPFLCAPYLADEDGRLRPLAGISRCPWATSGEECSLSDHSWRSRKTGPQFPVRVRWCGTHQEHFTIYPIAFVPYARCRLVPVDVAGHSLEIAGASARERWCGTMFCGAGGRSRRQLLAA